MSTRRKFLALLGGAASLPVVNSLVGCSDGGTPSYTVQQADPGVTTVGFTGPIGLQLYSVRNELQEDLRGTIQAVYDIGYREVEMAGLYGLTPAEFRAMLDEVGLACTGYMAGFERLSDDVASVASEANTVGATYVSCAWVPHQAPFDEDDLARAVRDFTTAGEALRAEGLHFCYHAHGYEFQPAADGRTLFHRFLEETEPGVVDVEMDVFWFTWPGQQPVEWIEAYPGRFPIFHLKDMRHGTQTGTISGSAPLETNVPVGEGMIDFPAILRAAEANGGQRYYVEYEYTDAIEAVRKSLEYLESLRA